MLGSAVLEFSNSAVAAREPSQVVSVDALREIPVLAETLLGVEFARHEFALDLDAITRVVLADPGATLAILRLSGMELSAWSNRNLRMEDCIAGVGVQAAFRALERGVASPVQDQRMVSRLWEHARAVATHAKIASERTPNGIPADHAYLGGLLHILGALPSVCKWKMHDPSAPAALAALHLADSWNLPGYIKDMFCEMWMPGFDPRWSELLHDAHRSAGVSAGICNIDSTHHASAS